jgi:radical SAM family uncharacterized protein/radical SAM-linked protein
LNSQSSQSLAGRIEALLPRVEKPGRYLGTEINAIYKPWAEAGNEALSKWLLILPDVYEIGMSHQGLRILYDILNSREDALAERAFAPWVDMEDLMRRNEIPLFSLETRHLAKEFDLVGFSLQYELLATNILNLLDLAGIPLRSNQRGEDDPLIVAGGPCAANPEPLAEFIDLFLIGDGEELVGRITETLQVSKNLSREEKLRALSGLPGIYVPRFYTPIFENGRQIGVEPQGGAPFPVRRTHVANLDAAPYHLRPVVPLVEAVQDRLTLEIQRGCTRGCRFCQAGIYYRPVRERGPRRLTELIAGGLPVTGWNEVSLSSLSSADYSQIEPLTRTLVDALSPQRIGLSFSSLRADAFSVELAHQVSKVRKTGLTLAPEAGTQRLRNVINKNVTESDLLAAIEAAYSKGWQRVKLYFMLGLPTETDADIEGIISLLTRIRDIGKKHGGAKKVSASLGPFVPKAHTPFQWEAFADRDYLTRSQHHIKDTVQSRWSQVKWHDSKVSFIEATISRGDRTLAPLLERVWRSGARFDGWAEFFNMDRWLEAFSAEGLDPLAYTGAIAPDAKLPWDHIDLGITKKWLAEERDRALSGEQIEDCRLDACTACGLGCDRPYTPAAPVADSDWEQLGKQIRAAFPAVTADENPQIHRYRIAFAKLDRLRFISHLELGRLLARIFRMAGWPIAYSQGHHPHPKIAYGPPLPLGVEGEAELIDVQLTEPLRAELIELANAAAPLGLKIKGAKHMVSKPTSIAAAIISADYRVQLPETLYKQAISEQRVEAFERAGSVIALKSRKGRQKTIDLKRCVTALALHDGTLDFTLLLQEKQGNTMGPLPMLAELFKWSMENLGECRVTRTRLYDDEGKPLDR